MEQGQTSSGRLAPSHLFAWWRNINRSSLRQDLFAGLTGAVIVLPQGVAFALLVPTTMWFAPIGVRLAYRLNVPQLKRVFSVFLLLVGLKMAVI